MWRAQVCVRGSVAGMLLPSKESDIPVSSSSSPSIPARFHSSASLLLQDLCDAKCCVSILRGTNVIALMLLSQMSAVFLFYDFETNPSIWSLIHKCQRITFSSVSTKWNLTFDIFPGKQTSMPMRTTNEALQKWNPFQLLVSLPVYIWADSPISLCSTSKSFINSGSKEVAAFPSTHSLSC